MHLRHQLAVHSPITREAQRGAIGTFIGTRADPRPELRARLLASYGAQDAVLCGSGTQALQLAIDLAMRHTRCSAPVALPGFSCFDVASAAIGAGAMLAPYDIDPDTLGPRWSSLERLLQAGTRVIVAASLYGVPIDWERLSALSERYGAFIVEDAAQGHGSAWRGRPLGSLAALSVLSFGRGKGWTGGGGGALLMRDAMPGAAVPALPAPGRRQEISTIVAAALQRALGTPEVYGLPRSIPFLALGETTYRPPGPLRAITQAAAAAILLNEAASADEARHRRMNAAHVIASVRGLASVRVIGTHCDAEPGYLRLPLRLSGRAAEFAMSDSGRRLGVEPSYPRWIGALEAISASLKSRGEMCPGAQRLACELFTFPVHSLVSAYERDAILTGLGRS